MYTNNWSSELFWEPVKYETTRIFSLKYVFIVSFETNQMLKYTQFNTLIKVVIPVIKVECELLTLFKRLKLKAAKISTIP